LHRSYYFRCHSASSPLPVLGHCIKLTQGAPTSTMLARAKHAWQWRFCQHRHGSTWRWAMCDQTKWLGRRSLALHFPDLCQIYGASDHFWGKLSASGLPTRPNQLSIPGVRKWVVIQGNVWLYWCRPMSVSAGLSCGLNCTSSLCMTHRAITAALCGLWRHKSAMPLPFNLKLAL